jgi:hypothetical protein
MAGGVSDRLFANVVIMYEQFLLSRLKKCQSPTDQPSCCLIKSSKNVRKCSATVYWLCVEEATNISLMMIV